MQGGADAIAAEIKRCRLCSERFAGTRTQHRPRPVVWFEPGAQILVAGQAPGLRVHETGKPFFDRSGDRLRDWMGVSSDEFYDRSRVAIVPMAFCFPGYDKNGSDLPPPKVCSVTWHDRVMQSLPNIQLTLLIGGHAQRWHLGTAGKAGVTTTVAAWRQFPSHLIPLPHPSWRNTGWLKRNPWFEADLVPHLRQAVRAVLVPRQS